MGVFLNQDHSLWKSLSAYQAVYFHDEWRSVALFVDVTQDDGKAKICFDLDGAGTMFELSRSSFTTPAPRAT